MKSVFKDFKAFKNGEKKFKNFQDKSGHHWFKGNPVNLHFENIAYC